MNLRIPKNRVNLQTLLSAEPGIPRWHVLAWLMICACQEPSLVRLHVKTDVPFERERLIAFTTTSNRLFETIEPNVVVGPEWGPSGELGTLVLIPESDRNAPLNLRVVMGVARDPVSCTLDSPMGCIISRRKLSFVEHKRIELPIFLHAACDGVACDEDSTCNALGQCVSAQIDPTQCEDLDSPGCLPEGDWRPDIGPVDCTGVTDWEFRVPPVLLSGDVNSSPGARVNGRILSADRQGVLVGGSFYGGKIEVEYFEGESLVNPSGGSIPHNIYVLGLTREGAFRFGYAPETRDFDPPSPFGQVPTVQINGLAADGKGGFWLSGGFRGILIPGPGKEYATPVPASEEQREGNALLLRGSRTGTLLESRVFGLDGQVDSFGPIAVRGKDLVIANSNSSSFPSDGVLLDPPGPQAHALLTLQPATSYAPSRIDYIGGKVSSFMISSAEDQLGIAVGGTGVLQVDSVALGAEDRGITVLLNQGDDGISALASFVSEEGYTYATSLRINASGDRVLSGRLRGTVSFGGPHGRRSTRSGESQ